MQRLVAVALASSLAFLAGCSKSSESKPGLLITTASLPPGRVGVLYSGTLSASGGAAPYAWSVASGDLPAGLVLDGATGEISGAPATDGTYAFTARVSDAASGSATRALSVVVSSSSGRLEGDPAAPALSALTFVNEVTGTEEAEISDDPSRGPVSRTQLLVPFDDDATAAQVNEALESIGARIVWMMPGVPQLLVRFPDPGSVTGLDAVASMLEARPGIGEVLRGLMADGSVLPEPFTASTAEGFDRIVHLLAVRAAAAWNAREGLVHADPTVLLVADYFGNGSVTSPPFAVDVDPSFQFSNTTYALGRPAGHGYHVLGIAAADFGGDLVTGMYPGDSRRLLDVQVVDIVHDPRPDPGPPPRVSPAARLSLVDIQATVLARLRLNLWDRNVVLNTSLGFRCDTPVRAAANCSQANAASFALRWTEAVRGAGLEDRFLHVTAAGNTEVAGDTAAALASPWTAAALLPLRDEQGVAVPNLSNLLVVENLVPEAEAPYSPACLNPYSKVGGHVSAVGTNVWSYVRQREAAAWTGTSMATPQVAAVAAQVWAFVPNLWPTDVAAILRGTARPVRLPAPVPGECQDAEPAPSIDAYAALLRADGPGALTTGRASDAPVRFAILDVASSSGDGPPDGYFDEGDLRRFLEGFRVDPAATILDGSGCGGYDWSRFDLNGDGKTGGCFVAGFDLDMDGVLATARQPWSGVQYPERTLRDVDVLCFYAYSPLYGGSDARDALLESSCEASLAEVARWESPSPAGWPMPAPYGEAVAASGSGDVFTVWVEPTGATTITCCSEFEPECWLHQDSASYAVRARLSVGLPAGDLPALSETSLLGTGTAPHAGSAVRVEVAVAADGPGNAIAAWTLWAPLTVDDACRDSVLTVREEVWASRYTLGVGWGPALRLWTVDGPLSYAGFGWPRVAFDPYGGAALAFTSGESTLLARYSAEGAWGAVEELNSLTEEWFRYAAPAAGWIVSVNALGQAVVLRNGTAGTFSMQRWDASAGWQPERIFVLPDFGGSVTRRVARVVLDDSGGVAYLGIYSGDPPFPRRGAWVARYVPPPPDQEAGTWSPPAMLYAGSEVPGSDFDSQLSQCRGSLSREGTGLYTDAAGNLTAWARDTTVLLYSSRGDTLRGGKDVVARVEVVVRRYEAASDTWAPLETVYSSSEETHDFYSSWWNGTTGTVWHFSESGQKTAVLGAGGSCSLPVLLGVAKEWGATYDGSWSVVPWCESSLHLARLGPTRF